jgi:hypothetical protein
LLGQADEATAAKAATSSQLPYPDVVTVTFSLQQMIHIRTLPVGSAE